MGGFGLNAIERLAGPKAMLETARHFVVDPGRRDQRRYRRFQPSTSHGDALVLRVQRIMDANLKSVASVPELAAEVGLTVRSLQRRFQKATDLNITQYLQQLRVERAKNLLADTGASVTEIAHLTGYEDVPAFHRVFRRIAGVTPSRFRSSTRH